MKMTETQKKDIKLLIMYMKAMADFMTNFKFAVDMSNFGCFFYEKLSDILKSDKESENEGD